MFGYIYKTTNLMNNKIYIGKKHSNIFIDNYFGSGKLIKRAIEKYGKENFKIEMIDTANDLSELNQKEKFYIHKYNSYYKNGTGYNIAPGGDGGNLIACLDDERYKQFIDKCKVNNKGENNPNYNKGNKIKGDRNPAKRPEVRAKLSQKLSGEGNPMYGKKQSKEVICKRVATTRHKYGKFPNQFTKNPNAKHPKDKPHYLYDGSVLIQEFKNKSKLKQYCINNLGFSGGMVEKCLKEGLFIKDITLKNNSVTYKKNLEAQNKYPNYNCKIDNTEVTYETKES